MKLFIPKAFQGTEVHGPPGRIVSGHHTDEDGKNQSGQGYPPGNDGNGCRSAAVANPQTGSDNRTKKGVHHEGKQVTEQHSNCPSDSPDHSGFHQEHPPDVRQVGSNDLHDADFPGSLIDGHDHGVGDAQRSHQKGDGAQTAQHHLLLVGLLLHGLTDALHGLGVVSLQLP